MRTAQPGSRGNLPKMGGVPSVPAMEGCRETPVFRTPRIACELDEESEAQSQRKSMSDWASVRKPRLMGFPTGPITAYAYQEAVSLVPAPPSSQPKTKWAATGFPGLSASGSSVMSMIMAAAGEGVILAAASSSAALPSSRSSSVSLKKRRRVPTVYLLPPITRTAVLRSRRNVLTPIAFPYGEVATRA